MPEADRRREVVRLDYQTPDGETRTMIAEGGTWRHCGTGIGERPLYSTDGTTMMTQRAATLTGGRLDGGAHRTLQNEIRAALRIHRRHGSHNAPGLPHLIGYNLDAESPFLLAPPTPGRPVGTLAGGLLLTQRQSFQRALFQALVLLAEAGVVHGGLRPELVHWDGREAHLTGFALSAASGEPYREDVASAWMPPWATRNVVADPRDDVWAAGLVVAHVATGLPIERLAGGAAVSGETALASMLDGVFSDDPVRRPAAAQILRRLGAQTTHDAAAPNPDAALEAGRAAFDAERAKKHGSDRPERAPEAGVVAPRPARVRPPVFVVLCVVLVGLLLIGWQVWR
jgi:hypothetical protein